MTRRIRIALLAALLLTLPSWGAGDDVTAPRWLYGLALKCRKGNQADFDKDTRRWGLEAFKNENNGNLVYIAETASVAVLPNAGGLTTGEAKPPKWLHGLALKCRRAGQNDFTADTPKFGVEVFRDEQSGNTLYISETGTVVALPGGPATAAAALKPPTWLHGLELRCRKAREAEFTKDTKHFGVEVFRDENNGNLIYISETGSIAVLGGVQATGGALKAPTWLYGLEVRCRKGGQTEFDKDTPQFGVEAFKDENVGSLVYISETGALAVLPKAGAPADPVKGPTWLQGLDLKCRKAGEPDFDKNTPRIGVEVFKDENNGAILYVTETGSLAALAGK
jgi:hypothetical protein